MFNRWGFRGARGLGVLFAVLAVGVLVDVVGMTPAAQAQQTAAVVTTAIGQVRVKPAGETAFVPLQVGMRVLEGADIVSGAGSRAELRLPDGSTLMVSENSRFVVSRLDYDAQNRPRAALFHLAIGKLRGIVAKAATTLVAARQGNFAITTPTAVAAVRGTELYVSVDAAGNTTFLAMNGIATITIGGQTVRLSPGQTVSATPTGFRVTPGTTTPAVTTAPPAVVTAMQSTTNTATAGSTTITSPQTTVITTPNANDTINTIVTTSTPATATATTPTTPATATAETPVVTLTTTVTPATSQVTDSTKPGAASSLSK